MINTLLKAKHWQIFLLVFGLPIFIYLGWLIHFFSHLGFYIDHDLDVNDAQDLFESFMSLILLMLIPISIQYAWFWSMAIGLQKKLPEGMRMNENLFKVVYVLPIVFILLYFLFLSFLFGNIDQVEKWHWHFLEEGENIGFIVFGFFAFFLLSLFMVFCVFYQYWFIAKTIKSAQLQKEAVFSEYVGEFFLVWFYPIGVWILQPTINKLMEGKY